MKNRFASLVIFLLPACLQSQSTAPVIHLNQSGFYIHAPKIAVISGNVPPGNFYVLRAGANDTVFKAALSDTIAALYSAGPTRLADFSAFNKPGKYVVYVNGIGNSYPFDIKNKVQHAVAVSSIRGFYYQRVSMPLEAKYAGKWS